MASSDTHLCACGATVEYIGSWAAIDDEVVCPRCGTVYEMFGDDTWDEEAGEEYSCFWLEPVSGRKG